jgi:hypothetical protein
MKQGTTVVSGSKCASQQGRGPQVQTGSASVMNVTDLVKATVGCGLTAFLIYSFPVISQVLIILLLTLLWLSYAHRALVRRR